MVWMYPRDFEGWQRMHTIRRGMWIYFDPSNRLAALIDPVKKIVYMVMDRKTEAYLYENEAAIKALPRFLPRKLV